ncbi:c-type cytochrome [Pseudoduganella namucuonensis]|uniref:Cytochrome c553 n=1 Tax=Pseudoduganella namucuonensis TaxID=1035707 RepID=A0A1I7G4H3_9BURK|nr:c-type cytochrome [Pseudoduganella namucuonensis]SFU43349.1 Cytochrome c553 [Pseudoduganella namucuonensis]
MAHKAKNIHAQTSSTWMKRILPWIAVLAVSTTANPVMAGTDVAAMETKTIAAFHKDSFGNRQGNAVRGKQIATQACAQCHGAEGNAVSSAFPSLSAQLPNYLASQLMLFKTGQRRSPVMHAIATNLAAGDMLDVAAYYASQSPGKPYESTNAELLAHGEKLYREGDLKRGIPACTWCHGPGGGATSSIFPRIGGQSPIYLEVVLDVLKTKQFHIQEAYVMKAILTNLSREDIKAVSEYTSTLTAAKPESTR